MNALVDPPAASPVAADRPPINTLAAIALALAFVTIVGGIVCGHVALSQIERSGERGRGLAIAALVVSYGAIVLVVGVVAIPLAAHLAGS